MSDSEGALRGVRVLDLTTARAELAGRLLADLGAEVLKIEPPGGSPARSLPPFEGDDGSHPEGSLYWAAVALGKRSAVVDLTSAEGRGLVARLAERSDILLESSDPGELSGRGLGYEELARRNPRLIYVSVTPFGQDGPKARWPATELTLEASSSRMSMQGDRDRPPLPVGYPQAAFHAGAQAAGDAIIALNERALSGSGQHLDISMYEVMIGTVMGAVAWPAAVGENPPGAGDDRAKPELRRVARLFPSLCECADGHVVVVLGPGVPGTRGMIPVVLEQLAARGALDERLAGIDWEPFLDAFRALDDDVLALAVKQIESYLRTKTKHELVRWAIEHDLRLAPVYTTRDVLAEPHFDARDFFRRVAERTHPGEPARLSRTPIRLRPAPRLGGDQDQLSRWLRDPAREPQREPPAERLGEAFAGLRVADFSWVAAGPTIAKALADHGATVVRIESEDRVDLVRQLPPFHGGERGLNSSHWMALYNTSKLSAAVNLGVEAGRGLARRIVDWADVVLESYSPGTMRRLSLDWETLTRDRDDLIMLSTSLLGQSGPLAAFSGYGQQGAAVAGLYAITGWPDRAPCGPQGPYTDVIAPKYGIAALAAAIHERRRTGLGQHIDVSQIEASMHFIEPLLLDETVNGRTARARGPRSPSACPHGVYATRGTERYIAIAAETPEQWRALCALVPLERFAVAEYDELTARQRAADSIDEALAAWCSGAEPFELEARLVAAGIPAAVVQRPLDLHRDPQLAHRGFHVVLDHSELGPVTHNALPTRFSAKRRMLHSASPCLGEHTDHVLRDLLGLSEAEIANYREAGALR